MPFFSHFYISTRLFVSVFVCMHELTHKFVYMTGAHFVMQYYGSLHGQSREMHDNHSSEKIAEYTRTLSAITQLGSLARVLSGCKNTPGHFTCR